MRSPFCSQVHAIDILCRMIRESGLKIHAFDGLDEAAETAVRVSL